MVKVLNAIVKMLLGFCLLCYVILLIPFLIVSVVRFAAKRFQEESLYAKLIYSCPSLYEIHNRLFTFPVWEGNFRRLPPLPGTTLHIACGTGFAADIIEAKGYRVIHMDMNLRSIEYGKSKGKMGTVVVGNAYHLPFKGCCFDRILISIAFHHILNHEILIPELKRVLKQDGKIIIIEPVSIKPRRNAVMNSFHDGRIWIFDQNGIIEKTLPLLTKNGLQIKSVQLFRPYSLQNYNLVYPMKDMILEIGRKSA